MGYAYRTRARVHIHLNDLDAALADANNAISSSSDNAYGYMIRCRVYVDLNQDSKALDDCNQAVAINPKLEEGYFQRGRAEIDLQKWTDAIADFTQAQKLDPGPNGKYWLAFAQYNNGDYQEGLRNIQAYIAEKGDDGDGYYVRAQIQLKLGNRNEAKASAQEALRHYRIDNDDSGAKKAQALLDSIGQGAS
jgi:tetratricopeptide (TPR) repeat protein